MTTSMNRLAFRLPDFTRHTWVSQRARDAWATRIERVAACWQEVEWLSVAEGVRDCCLRVVSPGDMDGLAEQTVAAGLALAPLDTIAASNGAYMSAGVGVVPGHPYNQRVVVGRAEHLSAFREAWERGDQKEVGRLLGYPACCSDFFEEFWVRQRFVDTTWPMALGTAGGADEGATLLEVGGPPHTNILLRWLGVRAVPHLPCSFTCEPSRRFGEELVGLARRRGHAAEADDLLRMLEWPVEWSALHGIAEIKTPVLKIAALTDATPVKYVVRRRGTTYPAEGAQGLSFPYKEPNRLRVTDSRGFQRGLTNLTKPLDAHKQAEWYFGDNGFTSRSGMDAAHRPLVELSAAALGATPGAVLDLGCGNGALLEKICERRKAAAPFGIDLDPSKVAHAGLLLPRHAANFHVGDFFNADAPALGERRYALALLMLGRLFEVEPERAAGLRGWLRSHVEHLLVYVYPGYANPLGDFESLARAVGVELQPHTDTFALASRVIP